MPEADAAATEGGIPDDDVGVDVDAVASASRWASDLTGEWITMSERFL